MTSSDNSEALDPELLAQLPNRYQIQTLLGSSVYSLVYRGQDCETGSIITVKCFSPTVRGAYLREMAAAFGIRHPNVTHCVDTFHLSDGRTCMVYEYIEAGTLRDYLNHHPKFDLNIVIHCLRQLLQALQYLHGQQLIHCDMKPENVLLDQTDDLEQTRFIISDLGAACFLREANEGQHTVGSPAYCAPERLYEKFSFNSDLYSLGVIGFELATGRRPFEGSATELARAHLSQTPDFAKISYSPLRDFVEQLMQKEPRLRPASAEAALQLLNRLERGYAVDEMRSTQAKGTAINTPTPAPKVKQWPLSAVGQWTLCARLPLTRAVQRLFVLQVADQPVIGAGYETHLEFLQPPPQTVSLQVLLHASPCVQVASHDQLLYLQGTRLMHLDLTSQVRSCLWDNCEGLVTFHVQADYLLWCTARSGHICHLPSGTEYAYRQNSYAFTPQVQLWRDGWLLTSGGSLNHVAQLRDLHGNIHAEWTLDGPIVECCTVADAMLALTLTVHSEEQQYAIWRLSLEHKPQRFLITDPLVHYGSNASGLFWLTQAQQFYLCAADLQPVSLGFLSEPVQLVQLSPDQRYIAAVTTAQTSVIIWANPGSE